MTAVHGNFAPSELVLLRAADTTALQQTVAALEHFLGQAPSAPLKDVAYTCSKTEGPVAVAVVTSFCVATATTGHCFICATTATFKQSMAAMVQRTNQQASKGQTLTSKCHVAQPCMMLRQVNTSAT